MCLNVACLASDQLLSVHSYSLVPGGTDTIQEQRGLTSEPPNLATLILEFHSFTPVLVSHICSLLGEVTNREQ